MFASQVLILVLLVPAPLAMHVLVGLLVAVLQLAVQLVRLLFVAVWLQFLGQFLVVLLLMAPPWVVQLQLAAVRLPLLHQLQLAAALLMHVLVVLRKQLLALLMRLLVVAVRLLVSMGPALLKAPSVLPRPPAPAAAPSERCVLQRARRAWWRSWLRRGSGTPQRSRRQVLVRAKQWPSARSYSTLKGYTAISARLWPCGLLWHAVLVLSVTVHGAWMRAVSPNFGASAAARTKVAGPAATSFGTDTMHAASIFPAGEARLARTCSAASAATTLPISARRDDRA